MADRWMPRRLSDSRYVWLPFTIAPDGAFTIAWRDQWDLIHWPTKTGVEGN